MFQFRGKDEVKTMLNTKGPPPRRYCGSDRAHRAHTYEKKNPLWRNPFWGDVPMKPLKFRCPGSEMVEENWGSYGSVPFLHERGRRVGARIR
jgi:hypothetical protein